MDKKFVCVLSAMFLFMGIVIGFFCAPIKKGIYCGNNNGCKPIPNDFDEEMETEDLPF